VRPPVKGADAPPSAAAADREVLAALDSSGVRGFHFRTIVVAGMGFFTDAYDLFVISLAIPILIAVYLNNHIQAVPVGLLASSALIGAAVGPLIFGFLGDRLGRRKLYAVSLSVMAVGAIGSAFSVPCLGLSTIGVLTIWRFILGVGIGGDYPLSATIMSEYSNVRSRGRLIATVFAMQGFGLLAGAAVSLGVTYFVPTLDIAWRVILGFGAVPALFTIYYRTRIPETPRFSLSQGDATGAAQTVQSVTGTKVVANGAGRARARVPTSTMLRSYSTLIIATALCWFLLDVSFYSTSIFNPLILKQIGFASSAGSSVIDQVRRLALGNVLIALIAAVPGYWAAVALIDRVGRRPLQLIGFGVMAAAFLLLSFAYVQLIATLVAFLALYGLTFFFANFGPNTTTFVYPSEVFPTSFRTTGHGIAASAGKLGAVIAVALFPTLYLMYGLSWFFGVLAVAATLGFLVTALLLPETSQRSLEDVSGEDALAVLVRRFSTYLRSLSLYTAQGASALQELLKDPGRDRTAKIEQIRALEHAADEEVHRIYVELNNRRLSAEVRADVGHIASALDDIMDGIEAVSARVETYDLTAARPEFDRFASIVVESVDLVGEGILALDDLYRGTTERLTHSIVEVNRLENEADDLLRELLGKLFQQKDPIEILKWKDFFERLEVITDRCEDVTDVFQDLAVRYTPGP
jgi:PHS family inorganic phosphate transporter-like MFS transporter